MPARRARPVDDGVTLVEVLVAMALMGIVAAFALGGFRNWQAASDHRGTAFAIQTVLRQTQVRAVSEGVSFCVMFNDTAGTYTVNRYACDDSPERVDGPWPVAGRSVRLASARVLLFWRVAVCGGHVPSDRCRLARVGQGGAGRDAHGIPGQRGRVHRSCLPHVNTAQVNTGSPSSRWSSRSAFSRSCPPLS